MEVLEEEVRKLQEQKAAVESANDELQRQNKYWEDLFSKQQLQFAGQISVAPLASSTNGNRSSVEFNSPTELTLTEHSQSGASLSGASLSGASLSGAASFSGAASLSGAESNHELSYTSLKMASDKGAKR